MDLRLVAAVGAGKSAGIATRLLRRGGGTALPGLAALRLDPGALAKLGRQLAGGRVLITGTNGKTTTARMLAAILEASGVPYVHNREGSNLARGMASTLIARSNLLGHLRFPRAVSAPNPVLTEPLGLFEADEASLPAATRDLAPRAIAFTNLFRDQLDRYGEVDTVAALWRAALAAAPEDATLVLNADDPSVAELALGWQGPVHWFGLDDAAFASEETGAFDARWCRACGGTFAYDRRYFAHVGLWRCTGCGRSRPQPDTTATNVIIGPDSSSFDVSGLDVIAMPLTGIYNVYNAIAAIAMSRVLKIDDDAIVRGLAGVRAAFGRQEIVQLQGRRLHILLCKNPAGANQVVRLLESIATGRATALKVALLLSDRFADGQDVSWIWDVDYELLAGRIGSCWAGGTRAQDIALRMKYAGWPTPIAVTRSQGTLLDAILADAGPGEDVYLVPTYTSMLDLRAELERRGAAGRWGEAS